MNQSSEHRSNLLNFLSTMSLNPFRSSLGAPTLCLLGLAIFNSCAAAAAAVAGDTYPYTVYRGTFIHLPRLNSSVTTPELERNQGALWVSAEDGRIKGFDWTVGDDASFATFMGSHGWVGAGAGAGGGGGSDTVVEVVESNDEQNEFFFPGFIGISCPPTQLPISQY